MGNALSRYEFHTALERAKVDAHNGIIYGVSVITGGITARGHELEVDRKTINQLKECAEKRGTVPVKWNHRSGADAVCGYLDNFRVDGEKLLGDWHLLKTHPNYAQAIELAERMPNNIGLSAAFMGDDEKHGGRKFARCKELVSVDLVAQPAANPDGLFEAKVDTKNFGDMNPTETQDQGHEPSLADVLNALQGLSQQLSEVSSRVEHVEDFQQSVMEAAHAHDNEEAEEAEEGQEGYEGDPSEAGEAGEGESVGTALHRRLSALENLRMREFAAAEQAEHEAVAQSVNEKVDALVSQLKELSAENEALRYAFRTRGAGALSHGGHGERMFEAGTPKQHLFEQHVASLVSDGMTKAKAIAFAQKEDPQSYVKYLSAKGIVKTQD
jgi:hypothetical protein